MKIGNRPADRLYAEAIKPIRNRMRQYSYNGLIDAALRYLNPLPSSDKVKDLQRLPWVVERLVVWILADNPAYYGNKVVDDLVIEQMVGLAWDASDQLYKKREVSSIRLFVRQHILPQIPYQVGLDTHAFALQLYLVKRLQNNSKLRKFLDQKAGMPIDKYFELAIVFWTHSIQEKPWFNSVFIQSLYPHFSEPDVKAFLNSLCYTKEHLHLIFSQRTIELDEWFQPTLLYKTPCVFHENTVIPFGRPTLRRHFENMMGDWLENEENKLLQHYNNLISQYMDFALERSGKDYLNEEELIKLIGRSVKPCDFLVKEDNGYVLFEVKNKSLTNVIPTDSKPATLRSKLKATLLKGKEQLDETRQACMNLPEFKNIPCYRVIVTNSDLWLGDMQTIVENYEDSLPIWLLSLEEIDHLVEIISTKQETFCDFFEKVAARNKQPELSVFSAGILLNEHPHKQKNLPDHLVQETDKVFDSLISKFS